MQARHHPATLRQSNPQRQSQVCRAVITMCIYIYIYVYLQIHLCIHYTYSSIYARMYLHIHLRADSVFVASVIFQPLVPSFCNWRDATCNFGDAVTVFDFNIICYKETQPQRCNYGEHMKHMQQRFVIPVLFVFKRCNHRDATTISDCYFLFNTRRCCCPRRFILTRSARS